MARSDATQVTLCENQGLGAIRVDLESFFEFSFWLAEELEDLVARQRHLQRTHSDRLTSSNQADL